MEQIIALGGGEFSMGPNNLALNRYILEQAGAAVPRVCFLPQASGEHPDYIIGFYQAFTALPCQPSHLSLFRPHTADIEGYLLAQDVICVGGGNTKSLLALWREWRLDDILRRALRQGTVLAGVSAGANCWFEQCTTGSIPGALTVLSCLGWLKGSCSPHYDGEAERRPAFRRFVGSGEIAPGHAFDDNTAGHFIDGQRHKVVSSRPGAQAYFVERDGGEALETPLETQVLPA